MGKYRELIDTGLVGGIDDPMSCHIHKEAPKIGQEFLQKKRPPTASATEVDCSDVPKLFRGGKIPNNTNHGNNTRRQAIIKGTLKYLVVCFKFADHSGRSLPSKTDFDISFMKKQGSRPLCQGR